MDSSSSNSSDVNKVLGCVAAMADGPRKGEEHLVIVSSRGGMIVPEKLVEIKLPEDRSCVTEFNRRGMVYKMDLWVRKSDVVRRVDSSIPSDFGRQGR